MSSGDLFSEVNTKEQGKNRTHLSVIMEPKVSVSPHRSLKSIKCVISEVDILDDSDEEIADVLSNAGVVEAQHITMHCDDRVVPTIHGDLTFDSN